MQILVTGGAGFIGSALVERLIADGHAVRVFDDLSTGRASNMPSGVDLVTGSVLDTQAVTAALDGAQSCVHLAGISGVTPSIDDPVGVHQVNVTGTINVLQAARAATQHVVIASSAAVYGDTPAAVKRETDLPSPHSPYAVSKLAAEHYGHAFAASFGVAVLPLRFFNVYGPRQSPESSYGAVIPAFIAAALQEKPLRINGDGTQTRDFVFVETVAAILASAVEQRVTSDGAVNVASGRSTSLLDTVSALETVVGHPLERRHGPPRDGDIAHSAADCARLSEWAGDIIDVPLATGLGKTLEWLDARG